MICDHRNTVPSLARHTAMMYKCEGSHPVEYQLFIANQMLRVIFDNQQEWIGHLVRPVDGIEARFTCRSCLEHLIAGLIGQRLWPQYRHQVSALLDQFQGVT